MPYKENVEKLLKEEIVTFKKKWRKGLKRVLLIYPNRYYVGMSNLGFQTIFKKINELPDFICERGFYPYPFSFESKAPFKNFDIIIFSISFELDFLNVIKLLMMSDIPILRKDRKKPVVAAGGIAITLNPYILKDVFDYQLIGEGEELIKEFLYFITENRKHEKIVGIFRNNEYERRVYKGDEVAHTFIFTKNTEFSETLLIEIARGCPFSCFFCAASYNYRPYRIRKANKIIEIIDKFEKSYKKVGLIGSSVLSHPDFLKIGEFILKKSKNFSVSSMRIDTITEEKIELILRAKNNTFTMAIEAGNDRLRKLINKKLTDEQIFTAIEKFIKFKVLNLKFYFLIGLPEETDEDIFDIVNLIKKFKKEYLMHKKELKAFGKFTISINPFIPKRNTPFFKYKFQKIEILERKIEIIKENLKKEPNVEVKIEDPYTCFLQYILSVKESEFLPFIIEKVRKNYSNKKFYELLTSVDKG